MKQDDFDIIFVSGGGIMQCSFVPGVRPSDNKKVPYAHTFGRPFVFAGLTTQYSRGRIV